MIDYNFVLRVEIKELLTHSIQEVKYLHGHQINDK